MSINRAYQWFLRQELVTEDYIASLIKFNDKEIPFIRYSASENAWNRITAKVFSAKPLSEKEYAEFREKIERLIKESVEYMAENDMEDYDETSEEFIEMSIKLEEEFNKNL